ncbi:hypothetical protein KPL74_18425 [Bacillus sp. NP157]|nr:hypothetical protein KPL74_18425 [Bacillus sp. NP157]
MSILLVVAAPDLDADAFVASEPMMQLWDRAQAAGEDLLWRPCRDVTDVAACLATPRDVDLILLDMDPDAIDEPGTTLLRDALNASSIPLIEIHDGSREGDLARVSPGHASLVSITVPGNRIGGYGMALSVGLRYLATQRLRAA